MRGRTKFATCLYRFLLCSFFQIHPVPQLHCQQLGFSQVWRCTGKCLFEGPNYPFHVLYIYITKTQLVLVLHLAIAMNYEETGGSVPLLACRIRSISSGVWASSSSSLASRISARSIGSSILSVSSVPCAFTDNYVPVVKFLLCLEEKREGDEQYTLPSSNHLPKQHTPHSPFRSIPSQGLPRRLPSCCTCLDVIHVDGVPNLNADRLYRRYIRCRVNGPVLVGYRMDRLVIPSWRWGRRGRA